MKKRTKLLKQIKKELRILTVPSKEDKKLQKLMTKERKVWKTGDYKDREKKK
jgi:uncharacterized membrane protein YgcG